MGSLCQGYPLEGKLFMSQRSDQFTLAAFTCLLCYVKEHMSIIFIPAIKLSGKSRESSEQKYILSTKNKLKGGDAYSVVGTY